jgi:hypothetical protein
MDDSLDYDIKQCLWLFMDNTLVNAKPAMHNINSTGLTTMACFLRGGQETANLRGAP